MKYSVDESQKKAFAGIYLLEYMVNLPKHFPVFLNRNDQDLEPVLEWLATREYISIREFANKEEENAQSGGLFGWFRKKNDKEDESTPDQFYAVTPTGKKALKIFLQHYSDFLHYFDIFCAVDLEAGEFAFAHHDQMSSDEEWKALLNQSRWDDLRIAASEFCGIDPVEVVFMSFIQERRFGRNNEGWQFDLLLGSVWDEILEICNSAIQWQQLGYSDDQGKVDAREVITDIVQQGADLIETIHLTHAQGMTLPRKYGDPDNSSPGEPMDLPSPTGSFRERMLSDEPFWKDSWLL